MNPVQIEQAQAEAERLHDLTPSELLLIKQRIREWATHRDDFAKGYVMRFAYTGGLHNREVINRILTLIERG